MKMRSMKIPTLLAAALISLSSGATLAHDDATLDKMTAPHGGQLRMAGIYHFELVLVKDSKEMRANPVLVYVTDHAGNKVPTAGASGIVTLLTGAGQVEVKLVPDGENRLKGTGTYASEAALKAVTSIALAGNDPVQARFTPLAQTAR
jgi:hypothetical protein